MRIALMVCLAAGLAAGADLEGRITDPAGGAVAGAELTLINRETGVERHGATNQTGTYRLGSLPAGEYTLRVGKPGFTVLERGPLVLQVGQVVTVNVELAVAAQSQQITVDAAAPIIETGRATVGAVVNRTEIDNLPINGRNFLDYSRTVAGVTAQQTSGQGSGLSFNGQRGRSNNISVDGADNNGQMNGNTRLTMSQEAVREFQVVTNQFAPEYGNAGGGLVNIVSRSGTNGFHGNVFYFMRDESLDARNAFVTDEEKPPFRRKNTGATLGGPIIRNRTFFFAATEYTTREESDVVTITDFNVETINAALAARPIPNGNVRAIANGTFPVDRINTLASLKLDHAFNQNNSLTFRYLYGQDRESNAGGVAIGGLTDVSGGGGQRMRDQSFLLGWTRVFSPTLLSETRFQYSPRKLTQYANDAIGPRIAISGVATFGRSANFPVLLDETRYQWQQSFSKQAGRHFMKFGTDIQHLRGRTSFPVNFAGTFSFANLADFVAGRPNQFTQGFGNPFIALPDTLIAFYWQDSFRITPKLTLAYGLRYDYDMQPQGVPRDRSNPVEKDLQDGIHRDPNNLGPRVALTYNPDGDGKTVIRTGYGVFYDKIFLLVARNALIARQTLTIPAAQAQQQWLLGAFPESDRFPTGFTLPRPSLNTVDPNIVIPYAQQMNFGLEREVSTDWAAGVNYVFVRGVKLLRSQNINLGPPTVLTAENAAQLGVARPTPQQINRPYFGANNRLNPEFTNIQYVEASSSSSYHGVQFTLQKRFSRGFQLRANYSLSKAIDDSTDFVQAQQPSNPYDKSAERALSEEDQRHRFTFTGVWDLPYRRTTNRASLPRWVLGDWVLSTLWVFRSGTPYTASVGSDVNADANSSTDRPMLGIYEMGRSTFTGPDSQTIDLRLSKRVVFRERLTLQVLAEAFNILNRVNYAGVNSTWGTDLVARATFGEYTSAANPRQVQLGIKFGF